MKELWIFGLGNPGRDYQQTKHNIGRYILEEYVDELGDNWKKLQDAEIVRVRVEGVSIVLIRSLLYMNISGKAVRTLYEYLEPAQKPVLMLLQDDSDQASGKAKLVVGGGTAGHWGVESTYKETYKHYTEEEIIRLKIGIRSNGNTSKSETFVLGKLSVDDKRFARLVRKALFDHTLLNNLISGALPLAQNTLNSLSLEKTDKK
jgi:peptidyl-tRNA hydrolase, PTH1 family